MTNRSRRRRRRRGPDSAAGHGPELDREKNLSLNIGDETATTSHFACEPGAYLDA
jgi:hypothetical protein